MAVCQQFSVKLFSTLLVFCCYISFLLLDYNEFYRCFYFYFCSFTSFSQSASCYMASKSLLFALKFIFTFEHFNFITTLWYTCLSQKHPEQNLCIKCTKSAKATNLKHISLHCSVFHIQSFVHHTMSEIESS